MPALLCAARRAVQDELEGLLALIDQDASGCIDYEVRVEEGLQGWGLLASPAMGHAKPIIAHCCCRSSLPPL